MALMSFREPLLVKLPIARRPEEEEHDLVDSLIAEVEYMEKDKHISLVLYEAIVCAKLSQRIKI